MKEVKITKENFMRAYENGCDDVKKVLKDLCPGEFGPVRNNVSFKITAETIGVTSFRIKLSHQGTPIGYIQPPHGINLFNSDYEAVQVIDGGQGEMFWKINKLR